MADLRSIQMNIEINVSKSDVWNVLFTQFGEVNNFNPLINGSHDLGELRAEVGCERQCDIGNTYARERIISVQENESFTIDIYEGGLPIVDEMRATWTLKKINKSTTNAIATIYYTTKPKFLGGIMAIPMKVKFQQVLVGLKYYLETGENVTDQNIRGIMKTFKKMGHFVKNENLVNLTN